MFCDNVLTPNLDREEAKKEENFEFGADYDDDDEEEWEKDADWNHEPEEVDDVKDESAAYLEFLNEEVRISGPGLPLGILTPKQAQKFTSINDDDDEELEEESLLETPLDKIEPYSMFKHALLRMLPIRSRSRRPHLYLAC